MIKIKHPSVDHKVHKIKPKKEKVNKYPSLRKESSKL